MSETVGENNFAKEKNYQPLSERSVMLSFLVFAGIVLPLITISVELYFRLCADILFDPIPTLWHVLLVIFVPLANAYILWTLYKNRFERITLLGWASAFSNAISLFYALIFAPVSPLAMIGIIIYGVGLLPLSPLIAFIAAILMRSNILRASPNHLFSFRWFGTGAMLLVVIVVIGLSEAKFVLTRYGMELSKAADSEKQEDGLQFLRKYGDENYVLKLAHDHRKRFYISDVVFDGFNFSKSNTTRTANEIYYRLTGHTTDEMGNPSRFGFTNENLWKDKNISLVASQMDGSIDNDASFGYLEWTFTFKNLDTLRQKEAFGQIQLPPGAVVSRLTLWINSEEREAAFAEKQRVTKAYQEVTAKRRDPVLVTTAGRDRINMRCFPIEPNGGEMKVRIGITFPLILEDEHHGLVRLPYFREQNFITPEQTKHIVWIESKKVLQTENPNLKFETEKNVTAIRGNLSEKELIEPSSTIRATKSDEFKTVWSPHEKGIITKTIEHQILEKPKRLIFVVDTSGKFKTEKTNIHSIIKNLSPETEVGLVLTHGNALNKGLSYPNFRIGTPSEIAELIEKTEFEGGTDNLPALTKAWDLAIEKEGSVVIWVHAPQPFKFSNSNELVQRLLRRPNKTEIFSISNANGFDVLEKELDEINYLKNTPRFGELKTDAERLLSQLFQSKKSYSYIRTTVEKSSLNDSKETSKHLVRLWANDEVNRILREGTDDKPAIELAQKYQIVTPVTGAVVLETQQQYDQFGLKPVDKNTVPTIPEPEFYLLLAVILGVFLWLIATRKLL